MVTNIENYRGVTNEELRAQLATVEACRDLWYRAYVRASTYAIDQIAMAVAQARKEITEEHGECEKSLKAMQDRIDHILRRMFLTDGRTGLHAVLPSAVTLDGDGPEVPPSVPPAAA